MSVFPSSLGSIKLAKVLVALCSTTPVFMIASYERNTFKLSGDSSWLKKD